MPEIASPNSNTTRDGTGLERVCQIALRLQHDADIVVGGRKIALPTGIAGIDVGQALSDGETVAKRLERL